MLPNDKTIAAFASYLPAEAKWQEGQQKDDVEEDESYYDEEDDEEEAEDE